MKIVVNRYHGVFGLSEYAKTILDPNHANWRTDPNLIALVEKDSEKAGVPYSRLAVVEIPDNATDYIVDEHSGVEDVVYVLDGKIRCGHIKL